MTIAQHYLLRPSLHSIILHMATVIDKIYLRIKNSYVRRIIDPLNLYYIIILKSDIKLFSMYCNKSFIYYIIIWHMIVPPSYIIIVITKPSTQTVSSSHV